MHIRLAELPQTLLEGMLLRHAHPLLVAWGEPRIGRLFYPGHGLLIEPFDFLGPRSQRLIVGKSLFEVMRIAEEMDPAALMQPVMDVVAGVEIAAQHAREVLADELLDHFPAARMMVFVIA